MQPAALVSLARPVNALAAGFGAMVGYLVATGTLVPGTVLLFAVAALVTGAGNAVNDLFDVEIDRVNRPDRAIPSGRVSRRQAGVFAISLFTAGLALAPFAGPLCAGIALFNALLLVAYAARLKRIPLAGNLAVSYLSASLFLFGGALAGTGGFLAAVPLAAITFLAMLARELLKDAEDLEGDRAGGAVTLPMVAGFGPTAWAAFLLAAGAVLLSLVPLVPWWGLLSVAALVPGDTVILWAGARALRARDPASLRACRATTWLKAGMFLALAAIAISSFAYYRAGGIPAIVPGVVP